MDWRQAIRGLWWRALRVEIGCLCSGLSSLGRGREVVVHGLGVPTGEIEVLVCAGHVGKQFGF